MKRQALPNTRKGDVAYRGYLIRTTLRGETFVEKDRTLICWAADEATAKKSIDELLD